ncbi:MAG: glycosyltransferase family 4 protein [Solirubrobacteraceae bacterium]
MRVLIFHGYLLGGTGSNVYNARLAAALVRGGHDVHLLCQERAPQEHAFVDATGDWDSGELTIRTLRLPVRCTVYRPAIGGLLPVYVEDRYAGLEVKTFAACTEDELERYIACNVAAVAEVAELVRPDAALANHLVMGPAILRRAGVGCAVKVHGSALEYTVKADPARFLPYAREGLAGASGVLVGSTHTARSLWSAMADQGLEERTRLGPPGVDVEEFFPRADAVLWPLVQRLRAEPPPPTGADAFARDGAAAAEALARLDLGRDRVVAFTGKLIVSKGVDLLLAAFPRVLARVPRARLVIVGFGAYRSGLERIVQALSDGDFAVLRSLAADGRAVENGPRGELWMLSAFLDQVESDQEYLRAAARLRDAVVFTGRLEHAELAQLLPACEAQVVPSTFPEAFGMVAAEAAACGALPLSAAHSGLLEVSTELAEAVPEEAARWLSFELGVGAVDQLAGKLIAWLEAPAELRQRTRSSLARVARERYSWDRVAERVLAAAAGRLDELPRA